MQRSTTVNPPKVHAAHTSTSGEGNANSPGKGSGALKFVLIGVVVLLLAVVSSVFGYGATHNGRVFNGVTVLGKDLGGMNAAEAKAALAAQSASYPPGEITVSGSGRNWTYKPADLGFGVDVDKTFASAMSIGRSAGFVDDLGSQFRTLLSGSSVIPALKNDPALVSKVVADIAAQVDKPALNSTLTANNGNVTITPSSHGSVVDQDATKAAFLSALASVPVAPVQLVMKDAAPTVTEDMLKSSESRALVLMDQPVTLTSGKKSWTLSTADLGSMIDISPASQGGGSSDFSIKLNDQALNQYLQPIAQEVHLAPKNASIVVGKTTVTLKKDVPGAELNIPGAAAAIQSAAASSDPAARTLELPLTETQAARRTADVQALYDKANSLVTQGIRLRFRDDGYIMRGSAVTDFLDVVEAKDGSGPKLVIDKPTLADHVSGIAYYVNQRPSDARFRMVGGAPKKIAEAKEGFNVDVDATTAAAESAIQSYTGGDRLQVDMTVAVTEPSIKDADLSSISTPDLLGTGQTSYAISSAERAWNVGLGTRNVDGALVPPGGTFSTVDAIGDLTLAAGFKMGYAIVAAGDGSLTTVPAEAGGICQVATTLFHSVFWAGLPIVERNWHSYWIGLYGLPPSGLQGLDATIAPPDKDFRFKNTTGHWLLIKGTADGKNVTFQIYGVNPHWKVSVSGPVITNRVKTNPAMITEYNDQLPAGKTVLVEHAQDGFDATISRTVTDSSGNVVDKWTGHSHYEPAHNRTLIGTGK